MTDRSKIEILRAFLAREGLAITVAEGFVPDGEDLEAKLLGVIELIQDFQLIPPVEEISDEPDAWDDAVTLEYPDHRRRLRPGNTPG